MSESEFQAFIRELKEDIKFLKNEIKRIEELVAAPYEPKPRKWWHF